MKPDVFYEQMLERSTESPEIRYEQLTILHRQILVAYLTALQAINASSAACTTSDGRTVSQVVAHIAEWERFTLQAIGEMIAGVKWPQIMTLSGYLEPEGQICDFSSVDEFNAYQAAKYLHQPWEQVRAHAERTAKTLSEAFTSGNLLPPDLLEDTREFAWRLAIGKTITLGCGWYLWMVSLAHESVDHADDLGIKT